MELIHHVKIYFVLSLSQLALASLQLEVGPKDFKVLGCPHTLPCASFSKPYQTGSSRAGEQGEQNFLLSSSTWQTIAGRASAGDKPREDDQRQRGGEMAWTEVGSDR